MKNLIVIVEEVEQGHIPRRSLRYVVSELRKRVESERRYRELTAPAVGERQALTTAQLVVMKALLQNKERKAYSLQLAEGASAASAARLLWEVREKHWGCSLDELTQCLAAGQAVEVLWPQSILCREVVRFLEPIEYREARLRQAAAAEARQLRIEELNNELADLGSDDDSDDE